MKTTNLVTLTWTTLMILSSGCSAASVRGNLERQATTPAIYTFESDGNGFNTKSFFYDNGQEVVALDTQFTPETAQKSIEFLRTKTQNPITTVVITHPNPDKFNGMSVFQRLGARVIASKRAAESMKGVHDYKKYYFVQIAKMFTEESYPKLSQVDVVFDQTYDLRLNNGETITLKELASAGVSSNQTVASIPAAKAVMVGDLIHHKAHAWLEGGIVGGKATPDLKGWISDLQELAAQFKDAPQTMVYGGRGEAAKIDIAVKAQIIYLKRADSIVADYIKALGDRKSELTGDKAGDHYKILQARFESAFPGYGLGYMIQYGVYGLVNSKL